MNPIPTRPSGWVWILLTLWVAWLAVGVFPSGPVEGDEQGVINGATAMARGETAYFNFAYLPEIQPGSYALLSRASRWTGVSLEILFAFGTAAGAALFAWFAARLLAHVLALPVWLTLVGLLWCQEVSAAACYMNTTALGMWLTFAALWLACRPPTGRTFFAMAMLIAVAGWIRIDCLLPTPAVPVLLWISTRNRRLALVGTFAVAAVSLILLLGLYSASGITWARLVTAYAGRGASHGWAPTIIAMPLILSPLVCGLLAAGLAWLLLRREWSRLALMVAGGAATLPIYGTSLASTKYFYHLVPFFLMAALYAVIRLREALARLIPRQRKVAATAFVLLAGADQLLALQTSSPEYRRYTPEPVLASLATLPGRSRPMHLVLGPGEYIPNADGFRLRGGAFFAPWAWHREKAAANAQLARFARLLASAPEATVYFSGWLPYQVLVRVLRESGYEYRSPTFAANTMPYSGLWTRAGHRVDNDYLAYRGSEYFDPARHPSNPTGSATFFIGDLSGRQPITELADAGTRTWQPLWPDDLHRFVTFFQRREPASP